MNKIPIMSKSLNIKRCLIAVILVCSGIFQGFSQTDEEINALVGNFSQRDLNQIPLQRADTIKTHELLEKARKYLQNRNDSTEYFAFQTILIAEKSGWVSPLSQALQVLGEYCMTKENFSDAIHWFILALKLEEKHEDQIRIADLNDFLGIVYFYQEIFPKSLEYFQRALLIYKSRKDTVGIAKSYSHLGLLYNSHEYCEKRTPQQTESDYDTALNYYQQSLTLLEKKQIQEGIVDAWSNIGNIYRRMGKLDLAIFFTQKAIAHYRKTGNMNRLVSVLRAQGLIYNRQQKYKEALDCLNECKDISKRENLNDGIQFLYEDIARTFEYQLDYKNSLKYYKKYMTLRDSVYNNEKSKQIFELETKYQTEKKQGEIERLTLIQRQRTLVIYILFASLLLVLVLGWMQFRNIRHKKIIADQKLEIKEKQLLELEKDRQLTAAKSVLLGEEAERSRLAGDLHDGLGGMLTGVKLKLSSMKENAILTSENLAHFNHALDLLDTSITEMRRVAHNLMPETLMHYGLRTALNDFIKQIAPEELPVIRLNTFGEDLRYEKEIEISLYRITQELITNALKHANASQIDIQLFTEKDRICVQVIDNGIGFDPEKLDPSKTGAGLKNIHDRVTAFGGKFEIISQQEKGTESLIEFLIS